MISCENGLRISVGGNGRRPLCFESRMAWIGSLHFVLTDEDS